MEFLVFDTNWDEWEWEKNLDTHEFTQPDPVNLAGVPWPDTPLLQRPPVIVPEADRVPVGVTPSPEYRYAPSFSPSPRLFSNLLDAVAVPTAPLSLVTTPQMTHRHSDPVLLTDSVTVDPKDLFGGANMASTTDAVNKLVSQAPQMALAFLERGRSQLLGSLPMDLSNFYLCNMPEVPEAEVAPLTSPPAPSTSVGAVVGSEMRANFPQVPNYAPTLAPIPVPEQPEESTSYRARTKKVATTPRRRHSVAAGLPPTTAPARKRAKLEVTMESPEESALEELAFPCLECDKNFKRLEHLKRHIRLVHLNIRPYHCKYCEKKFSRLDNLAQHLKTHFRTDVHGNTSVIHGNPNQRKRKLLQS